MHITEVSEVLGKIQQHLEAGQLAEAQAITSRAYLAARNQETAYETWLEETAAARHAQEALAEMPF